MKKAGILAAAAALAASILAPAASAAVSIKLKGGAFYAAASEYNAGWQGVADFAVLASFTGDYHPLHAGPEVGAEIIVPLGGGFGLGLGAGWQRATRESVLASNTPEFTITDTITPRITVVPLVLNLHREWPLGRAWRLDAYAGVGCCLVALRQEFRMETDFFESRETDTFTAHKAALSGQAGAALEFEIGRSVGFFVQAEGRLARLTDIKGDLASLNSYDLGAWTTGPDPAFLWAYTVTASTGTSYPQIAVAAAAPSSSGVEEKFSAVRKAVLDLSGAALAAGVRIRL